MRLFIKKENSNLYIPSKGINTRGEFIDVYGEEFTIDNDLINKAHVSSVFAETGPDTSYIAGIASAIIIFFILFFTQGVTEYGVPAIVGIIIFIAAKLEHYFDKQAAEKFNNS